MKRLTTAIIALAAATAVSAQGNTKYLFSKMDYMKGVERVGKENYYDNESGSPTTYCLYDELVMGRRKGRKLRKKITEAFSRDAKMAYKMYVNNGDTNNQINITYGPNQENAVTFGTKKGNYYLANFYNEKNDSLKRHAYGAVWSEKDNGKVSIKRYHIYGDNPSKVKTTVHGMGLEKRLAHLSELDSKLSGLDNLGERLSGLDRLDSIFMPAGKGYTINPHSITVHRPDGSITQIDPDGKVTNFNQYGQKDSLDEIKDEYDFMQYFSTLRVAFCESVNKKDQKLLTSGLALKIVELCKKHASVLSTDVRTLCKSEIRDMSTMVKDDNYVTRLLTLAAYAL